MHGLMQSCSLGLVDTLVSSKEVAVPDIPSFTVFVSSIAEAVALIAAGKTSAGTYTLISEPAWSWRELVDWWGREGRADVRVRTYPVKSSRSAVARSLQACPKSIMSWFDHHRERLATYLWYVRPQLAERLIANRYLGIARQQIAAYQDHLVPKPIAQFVSVPGIRFPGLSDSRQSMPARHAAAIAGTEA